MPYYFRQQPIDSFVQYKTLQYKQMLLNSKANAALWLLKKFYRNALKTEFHLEPNNSYEPTAWEQELLNVAKQHYDNVGVKPKKIKRVACATFFAEWWKHEKWHIPEDCGGVGLGVETDVKLYDIPAEFAEEYKEQQRWKNDLLNSPKTDRFVRIIERAETTGDLTASPAVWRALCKV